MPFINSVQHVPQRIWTEISCRFVVILVFIYTEKLEPFFRVIQPEEYWLYKFPTTVSYVPSPTLWVVVVITTVSVIFLVYAYDKDAKRALVAFGVPTLALPLNGIITNLIKVTVGRPRPDYFNRCFGDKYLHLHGSDYLAPCTGEFLTVLDGRKSFPSGHSSMSFCGMGFIFLYLAAQFRTFSSSGRGRSAGLVVSLIPLLVAMLIAISRTCDYHHHWQDITIGSLIGIIVVYTVYRQYFPSLTDPSQTCDLPVFEQQGSGDRVYNRRGKLIPDSPTTIKTV